jgi:CTP synthase
METIYQVPLLLHEQGLLQLLQKGLQLGAIPVSSASITKGDALWQLWKKTVTVRKDLEPIKIALVGKYTQHMDSYLSTVL